MGNRSKAIFQGNVKVGKDFNQTAHVIQNIYIQPHGKDKFLDVPPSTSSSSSAAPLSTSAAANPSHASELPLPAETQEYTNYRIERRELLEEIESSDDDY